MTCLNARKDRSPRGKIAMSGTEFLTTKQGRKLAYNLTSGDGPIVVFCGGYSSDMTGTKAVYLENWAKETGRGYLRFDYSGHGASSEDFIDGTIGSWAEDAFEVISTLIEGPLILVGSSMGGWISCLMSKRMPERIAGFVGIAAAPDFTEDSMYKWMSEDQKSELEAKGLVYLKSEGYEPYAVTKTFIEEARNQLVLRSPLPMHFPVRLLHGTEDTDVQPDVALSLLDHIDGDDVRLTLVKGADHRFSDERCLRLIRKAIHSVTMAE